MSAFHDPVTLSDIIIFATGFVFGALFLWGRR
jgi:hypothetical protein